MLRLLLSILRILEEEDYVAVLFYEDKKRESMKALQHLEMIDDEADLFGIRSTLVFYSVSCIKPLVIYSVFSIQP